MCSEGTIEREGSLRAHCCSGSVVHGGRGHQADAAVAVLVVVPVEELLAVRAGVLDRAEPFREVRTVFQGLELRLGVAVRVGRELQLIPNLKRRSPSRSHTPSTPGAERSPYS